MEQPRFNLLIVDDNQVDRIVARRFVLSEIKNIENIYEAENGLQALDWLKVNQTDLNQRLIILLDIQMPVMDGFSFLTEFEQLDKSMKEKIKIFMLSSTFDRQDIQRANENNLVERLMGKPIPIEEFKELIQKL